MARKDDELEDNDNLNKDSQDDFNEADDSFGLPDVDYQPIDRDDEFEDESEETTEEPEEHTTYTETYSETTYTTDEDDNTYVTETEHTYTTETETNYSAQSESDYYNEPEENTYVGAYDEEPREEVEETAYVPGSYKPPKDNSMLPKILVLIFVLLLAGLAIWYFGFYGPAEKAKVKAKIEQQNRIDAQKRREAEAQQERERLERERLEREEAERLALEAEPKIGTIETISSRTGRYHVVIASAIDEDLAMDHAKKLRDQGISTSIIKPFGKSKFHRIAVGSHDSWASAESSAVDMRAQYGDGVWVIKY